MGFYVASAGGFAHYVKQNGELAVNGMASQQAGYALAAYDRFKKGKNTLYDMFDAKPLYIRSVATADVKLSTSSFVYDGIVCVDVGQNQIFTCKYLPQKHGRLLTSGGLGTMGYALPAGVGAKVAAPDRQTVVICGDGSFQMAMNELSAIVCEHMDVKIVLFQNQVLGLVNQIQNTAPYHGAFGVALDGSPDFAALAGAYGIPSMCADDEDKLDGVLEQFLSAKGSCLLICKVHPDVGTND